MISEAMQRAGWRPMPDDATRKAWEERDGVWMTYDPDLKHPEPSNGLPPSTARRRAWRPEHPSTWDYAPEGWGEPTPEDVFNRAARDLPDGWRIEVCLEKDAGWLILTDAKGEEHDVCRDDRTMEQRIDAAVKVAGGEEEC